MPNQTPLRVIFAGTPEFAAVHLRYLLDHHCCEIVAVFTQPDRPAGRGKKLTASPVKEVALAHQLPVCQPSSLRDKSAQEHICQLSADLMIVVAYGLILPGVVLETPRLGCINVHASLLPRWRGAAPIQRAIEAGDTETGITIMQMDEGLDTGDILLASRCSIEATDTGASLQGKLLALGGPALESALGCIANHALAPCKQDDSKSNYASKITKAEARLDWGLPADVLERKIRAFNPFPVAYFGTGENSTRIWQAQVVNQPSPAAPGTVLHSGKEGIRVATGKNQLLLQQLQQPGKKVMSAQDVLNGHASHFTVGSLLS
jgi:methionyl-tRNA formyltransferase